MNIAQLSEQLKDVPQGTLVGYAKNPNSVVPQFLALAEIQRRQHLQAQAPAPSGTVADDVLAQAAPQPAPQMDPRLLQAQAMQQAQQLPENQPGVAQLPTGMPQGMASGGIVAFAGGGSAWDNDEDEDVEMAQLFPQAKSSRFEEVLAALPNIAGGIRGLADKGVEKYKNVMAALPTSFGEARKDISSAASGAADSVENFLSKIKHLESRGRSFDSKGNILTSPKGAEGSMQVMPKTQLNPGFGVTPARNRSPEELERVGRDYGIAMLNEFKDPQLAAMAYNWGPANVKKWLASDRKMPIPKETSKYASNFADGGIVALAEGGAAERQAAALEALNANMPSDYDRYQSDVPMSQSDYYRQRALAEAAIRENIPVPRAVRPEESRVREVAYGKAPVYGSAPAPTKQDLSAALEMTPGERNRYSTITENNKNLPATAIAPYAPSKEDYDIGFGPNKYGQDAGPAAPAPKTKADLYAEALEKSIEKQVAEAEQNRKLQLGLSLLGASAAGLQSGSPYFSQGVGASLSGGVNTYGALKKQEAEAAKDIMGARLGLYKYGAAAEGAAETREQNKLIKEIAMDQRKKEAATQDYNTKLARLQSVEKSITDQVMAPYKNNELYKLNPEKFEAKIQADLAAARQGNEIYKLLMADLGAPVKPIAVAGPVVVQTPKGPVSFPNQEAADQFKKKAGIK